jgi:Bifunctional DNA primase/polymerase, N-terminal
MTEPARTKQPESNLSWALRYAAAGMSVFPITAAKEPLVRWRKGDESQRATTDPATIETWWAKWPFADCGWALPENVLVVDVDRKDGRDGYVDFKRIFGCDPRDVETPMTTSPSGGLHLFYRAAKAYKNAVAIDRLGLDTRSEGGLVLLPTPNSGREWLRPFIGAEIMPAPEWFDRILGDAPSEPPRPLQPLSYDPRVIEQGRTALERACNRIVTAPCGSQEATLNTECFSIGGMIGRGDLDYEEADAALFQAALAMPAYKKPWTGLSEHVDRSLEDGMAKPMPTRDEESRRVFYIVDDTTTTQREAEMDGGAKGPDPGLPIPTKPPVYNGMIAPRDSWMMPPLYNEMIPPGAPRALA